METESVKKYSPLTFTMTSGRRLDLLIRTMESFLKNCQDQDLIVRWICGDDRSSGKDLIEMKDRYPFLEIYPSPEKGQMNNLIHIFSMVKTEWVIHIEDDWDFYRPGHFLRQMLDVTKDDDRIKNVVLRGWNGPKIIHNDLRYHLHINYGSEDINAKSSFAEITKTNDCLWSSYSCNPGLQHIPTILPIILKISSDPTIGDKFFEYDVGIEYKKQGFFRANLELEYIKHTGGDRTLFSKAKWKD